MSQNDILTLVFVLLSIVTMQTIFIFYLSKMVKAIIDRMPSFKELRAGDKIPHFTSVNQHGARINSKSILKEAKVTCFLFIDTNCSICRNIIVNLKRFVNKYNIKFVVLNENKMINDTEIIEELTENVIYINDPLVFKNYSIKVVPQALLVANDGIILKRNVIPDIEVLEDMLHEYKS
ncbi:redoxin family protein [Geobacillus sp. TFV-3]|uniref:redoxin family protein n=1 Tax=Geobacillus sp. TFV-3 TaxID=1897059 RepID=UPI00135B0F9E|nr:redoxin family protein [Geobacillus sp. TFV-3]KAF0993823.1 hypothetical protein BJQ97_00448 [Geobacillus sp. TFV-3]